MHKELFRMHFDAFSHTEVKMVGNKTYWKKYTKQYLGFKLEDKTSQTIKDPCKPKSYYGYDFLNNRRQ